LNHSGTETQRRHSPQHAVLGCHFGDATETTSVGTTGYGYDDAGRVTSIAHKTAGGTTIDTLSDAA
jgi:YD repeat-containing protein